MLFQCIERVHVAMNGGSDGNGGQNIRINHLYRCIHIYIYYVVRLTHKARYRIHIKKSDIESEIYERV